MAKKAKATDEKGDKSVKQEIKAREAKIEKHEKKIKDLKKAKKKSA